MIPRQVKVFKDINGNRIGYIQEEDNLLVAYDEFSRKLGFYDGVNTYDKFYHKVASGDKLEDLIFKRL